MNISKFLSTAHSSHRISLSSQYHQPPHYALRLSYISGLLVTRSLSRSSNTNTLIPTITSYNRNITQSSTTKYHQPSIIRYQSSSTMSSNTIQMNSIRIHKTGDASVLQYDTGLPLSTSSIQSTQVLVEIAYAGVNFIDTYHRTGLYPLPLPATLGREASGIVRGIGSSVKNIKVGDRVAFMDQGTYSTHIITDEKNIIHVPSSVSLRDAAAVLLQGTTAHYLTRSTYPLKANNSILVHAAAGGTGAMIVQIAKNCTSNVTVIATAGSAEKCKEVKDVLGADHVINYQEQANFVDEVKRITSNKGVNAVYDGVGKSTWEGSMKSLKKLGYLVLFGNASGPVPPMDPLLLSKHGSIFVTRPTLVDYTSDVGVEQSGYTLQQRVTELFQWIADGKISVRIGQEFDLKDAAEAHRYLESRQSRGKIVLRVNAKL